MLRIAVVVLLLLWVLSLVTGRTMGGFVHVSQSNGFGLPP